jgi:hypothetical protein
VDLVDEQDVPGLERGEHRGDVLLLERGPGNRAKPDAERALAEVDADLPPEERVRLALKKAA